ncbi:MAG TPA: choice-of-anchor tandem repeat GloVer-containing protein, partial [Candidatus Methylomirabilis sp.]|nr:choice-of-anchor tandem repeat GloVer-containing protein [Candidatus Methylomirabilis sp.]
MAFVAVIVLMLSLVSPPESSAAENWSFSGPMTVARAQHTATLLPDGRVLVAGGNNASGALQSAEIFTPASGTWAAVASMTAPRAQHTATLLPDGRVLVAGGENGNSPLSSAEIFNPGTNGWSAAAGMQTPRFQHTATALPDGRLLIAGGQAYGNVPVYCNQYCTSCSRCGLFSTCCHQYVCGQYQCGWTTSTVYHGSVELYDPSANTWSYAGGMSAARTGHAATSLPTGHVLVAGGTNQGGDISSSEEYDPAANSWSSVGAMGAARSRLTATMAPGDRAILAGGLGAGGSVPSADIFDCGTEQWTAAPTMTDARSNHASVMLQDGRVLVTGGYLGTNALSTAELFGPPVVTSMSVSPLSPAAIVGETVQFTGRASYGDFSMRTLDPGRLEWTPAPWMPTPRGSPMAAAIGGDLFVAGGHDGAGASPRLDAYDASTRRWVGRSPMPAADGATGRYGGAIGVIDNRLYVAGGWQTQSTPYSPTRTLMIYDSATNVWSVGPSMPTLSACSTGGSIGGKFYVVTGCDEYGYTSGLHVYDPGATSWATLAPPPHIHAYPAGGVIGGKLYVAGGLDGSQASGVLDVYDPQTGGWTTLAPMSTARWSAGGGVIDGKLYAIGGYDGSNPLAAVEVYDPTTNSWSANTSMPTVRRGVAAAVVNGQVFAAGGLDAGGSPLSTVEIGGGEVAWTSGTPAVAPITAGGLASAATPGTTSITAGSGGKTGTTTLTVNSSVVQQISLHVSLGGDGSGSVTSSPAGIACGTSCDASFDRDTTVTLTAIPNAGSRFTSWSGACTGTAACVVSMDAAESVIATFTLAGPYDLQMLTLGSGAGTVISTPAGISCPAGCTAPFAGDSQVSLRATPAAGSVFAGWSGGCSGTGVCVVGMTEARTIIATFVQVPAFAALRYAVLHGFNGSDGAIPSAGLIQASDGNFYGTTSQGGGAGTVFRLSPSGILTTLHNFSGSDGAYPYAGLIQASDGKFYGTTSQGGAGYGTVFRLTPAGEFTSLKSFYGFDGANPFGALVQGSDGNLYGATNQGGSGYGTVFRLTPAGEFTSLKSLLPSEGANPYGALAQGGDGSFYGTTYAGGSANLGTVFRLTPAGVVTTIKSFSGADGAHPYAGLVRGSDGSFYGTTYGGGAANLGTAFRITAEGAVSTLKSFSGVDGTYPRGGLVEGSDGFFYGTTTGGGTSGGGTIFRLSGAGALTTIHAFDGNEGAVPWAGLIQAGDGNFYGTTSSGGAAGAGVAFVLRLVNGLTVTLAGNGAGTVTSSPDGIDCGATCGADFASGTSVTLTAAPDTSSTFTGWDGACSGSSPTCALAMDQVQTVTATFALPTYTIAVTLSGTGTGTVASDVGGIACGGTCTSMPLESGTAVTLTATPSAGSIFAGWSGACTGTGACALTLSATQSVTATFSPVPTNYTLTIATAGTGTGTIGADPAGPTYTAGTQVTLTATPGAGSTFTGWSGDCSGTLPTCTLTMSAARSVTATFALAANAPVAYWTFDADTAIDTVGTHHGTITGSGVTFATGKVGRAISFSSGTSFVKIPSFNLPYLTLSAWVNSSKYGYYTSMVTKSSHATEWSSPWVTWELWFSENTGSPGTNGSMGYLVSPDTVPMHEWFHLAATYDGTTAKLYVNGVEKASTPAPAPGPLPETDGNIFIGKPEFSNHSFLGLIDEVAIWDHALSAAEIAQQYQNGLNGQGYLGQASPLTVTREGTGTGSVTSSPAGIACGATCTAAYVPNTVVTLTANPDATSTFRGWSSPCTGTTPCVVTMDTAKSLTATFELQPVVQTYALTVTLEGSGGGTVASDLGGITCAPSCAASYDQGTAVTLTAVPSSGFTFTGWSGACTGIGTCQVTMDAAKSVTATFTLAAGPGTVTPYVPEASTILLDHFDGSTSASLLAYRENGAACGAAKPAATPNAAYGSGPTGLSQALHLYPPVGEPVNSQTYLQYP